MDLKKYKKNTRYDYWQRWKRRNFTKANKKCKQGQIVLLGDSITEMYDVNLLKGISELEIYNRGIGGDTTIKLLQRLDKNVLCLNPSQLVLLIGTNDFGAGADVDYVYNNIIEIINILKTNIPNIELTLQCVYPVNSSKYELEPNRNENINKLNSLLKEFANNKDIKIIDFTNELKAEDGSLDLKYSDDGVHPNETGFRIVTKHLSSIIH